MFFSANFGPKHFGLKLEKSGNISIVNCYIDCSATFGLKQNSTVL